MSGTFVFIESNTTGSGQIFLKKVLDMGMKVLFLTSNPSKYPFLQLELVQPFIMDTSDHTKIIDFLNTQVNIKAVFSSSDFFIYTAASISKSLGLPHNNLEAISTCRDKFQLYEKLKSANIPVPDSYLIKDDSQAKKILKKLNYPIIIKPISGSGSNHVKLCKSLDEASKHIHPLISDGAIVQTFIDGNEYSIETISKAGKHSLIGITKKYLSPLPYFVETGHDFPALCKTNEAKMIEKTVMDALSSIHYSFGPAHTELRIIDNKPYIIEINPRLAGGMIPQLILNATGIDMLQSTINLYLDKPANLTPTLDLYSSIRFLLAKESGIINKLCMTANKKEQEYNFTYCFTKKIGDHVELEHNFKDRLGYVITTHHSAKQCIKSADFTLALLQLDIKKNSAPDIYDSKETGILKESLHPKALEILSHNLDSSNQPTKEFELFSEIDQTHLIMLNKSGIVSTTNLKILLKEIQNLRDEKYKSLVGVSAPRGAYLLYERELINRLGIEVAGLTHSGRSRNDLQETVFRINLREGYFQVNLALWHLRSKVLSLCKSDDIPLPIYSQYQTAMPGTVSHYMLGIEQSLFRDQTTLNAIYSDLNVSPLGSGACGGTSFPIQPAITAKLLGFDGFYQNSLDAIASKDLYLRFLSLITIMGSNMSRLTKDLQLWSTREFNLIRFPDNLVGGSSMLPQKRNPYLLEAVQARLDQLPGQLISALFGVNKIPFGNSYESKNVVSQSLQKSINCIRESMELLQLILEGIQFNQVKIEANLRDNLTLASIISESLAKKSGTIKEAHKKVGQTIYDTMDNGIDPLESLIALMGNQGSISDNPLDWAHANIYGGGPGKEESRSVYYAAVERLNQDARLYHEKLAQLEAARKLKISTIAKYKQTKSRVAN